MIRFIDATGQTFDAELPVMIVEIPNVEPSGEITISWLDYSEVSPGYGSLGTYRDDIVPGAGAAPLYIADVASDIAGSGPFIYSLSDDDGGRFSLSADGFHVYIATTLGSGRPMTHNFTYRATAAGGGYVEQQFTLIAVSSA